MLRTATLHSTMLEVAQQIELEILARELLATLEAERDAAAPADTEAVSPDKAIGRLSRLDAMQMQQVAMDAERRRENRITELTLALQRMDDGEYGTCQRCRATIAYTRLEALPEARFCGQCA
jgi:DnaK suppressor protein